MSFSWQTPFGELDPLTSYLSSTGSSNWNLPDYSAKNPFQPPTGDFGRDRYTYGDRFSSFNQTDYQPAPRGQIFDATSSYLGWSTITSQVDSWLAQTHPELFDFNNTANYNTQSMTSLGGDWSGVDQWNAEINAAAGQAGVPANLIKAVMKLESDGVNLGPNDATAVGPMQVTINNWGTWAQQNNLDLYTPADNILAGAMILKQNYDEYSDWAVQQGINPWKAAVYAYYAGNPYNLTAADKPSQGGSGISTAEYGDRIWNSFTQLQLGTTGTGQPGQFSSGATTSTGFEAITGGQPYPITQDIGLTDFAQGQLNGQYAYGADYGITGHAGIDVGTPLGTKTFSPVAGEIIYNGGTGYYQDYRYGNSNNTGELLIKLDNGDELILGHMGNISVQVGQRVTPGMYVGESGFGGAPENGGGPHIHVEYRKYGENTPSGFLAVDPRLALGGAFAGRYSSTPGFSSGEYVPAAQDWNNFMRNAATGGKLYGSNYSPDYGGSSFGSWIRNNAGWIPGAIPDGIYTGKDVGR